MNVLNWLLDSDPAIRWQVLHDIVHAPAQTITTERARTVTEGWGARLLALQGDDGQWAGGARLAAEQIIDDRGQLGIVNATGPVNTQGHPFFEPLGANGRACVTCHQPAYAMTISAAAVRERWQATQGKDPLFAAVDGSNCPDLPQQIESSHSLLLDRGLMRLAIAWPPTS